MDDLLGEAVLKRVALHVQQTGHRSIYSTVWPTDGRVGFSCADCEAAGTFYSTWTDRCHLADTSSVWKFLGPENHPRLVEWVATLEVPDAWKMLLGAGFLDESV